MRHKKINEAFRIKNKFFFQVELKVLSALQIEDSRFKSAKSFLVFILVSLMISPVLSQEKIREREYSEQVKELITESTICNKEKGENCNEFLRQAIKHAKENKECVPCIEIVLAHRLMKNQELDSADFYFKKILEESSSQRDSIEWELKTDTYNFMTMLASWKGEEDAYMDYIIKSLEYAEKIGEPSQISTMKANLGVGYMRVQNYEKAISLLKESFYELDELGSKKNLGLLAGNIASSYNELGKIDSMEYWSRRAISLSKEVNDLLSETAGYYLLALSLYEVKSDSALIYVNRAIDLAEEIGDDYYIATSYNIKGNLTVDSNYPEAKMYYLKSLEHYKKMGMPSGIYAPMVTLGKEAFKNKDFEISARHLYDYVVYNDSVLAEDNRRLVHEMETLYQTEKKEKQIAEQDLKIQKQRSTLLLSILGGLLLASFLSGFYLYAKRVNRLKIEQLQKEKENAILNSFIQGEERERNRISHELHDGVAAMIGAAKMSLDALPHLSDEKQKEQLIKIKGILENTHADVRHIAHNLLPVVLEKDGIIKATEQFASEINDAKLVKVIVENANSQADKLPKQLQLMLFRVIQELVNNIIKHSQAETATISFSKTPEGLNIEVTDDGIGYDGGLDSDNQGLYSITQRLKSIGGNFKFIRRKEKGMKAIAEVRI